MLEEDDHSQQHGTLSLAIVRVRHNVGFATLHRAGAAVHVKGEAKLTCSMLLKTERGLLTPACS